MSNRAQLRQLRDDILSLVGRYAAIAHTQAAFIPGKTEIPPSGKVLGEPEIIAIVEAALDAQLTSWRFDSAFTKALAQATCIPHVLTVNSGSSANLLALTSLMSPLLGDRALRTGDEVITVAAGFPTTVNPIVQNGLVPVFVDISLPTYNIDPSLIEAAIGPRTRAVMLAHTLGNPFDLGEVRRLCDMHGLWLVEDCCDALGSTYAGQPVGTSGDVATLSFYPAHHITTGEGGAVLTRSAEIAGIVKSLRDWGRDCHCPPGCDNTCGHRFDQKHGTLPHGYDHKYVYSHVGYNLKLTDMQAACGLAQMDRLPGFVAARRRNFAFLRQALAGLEPWIILPEPTRGSDPAWFGFPITLKTGMNRLQLLRNLEAQRIGTRLLFAGNLTRQPAYAGVHYRVAGNLSATDRVMRDTFWLGIQPALGEAELGFVAERMHALLKQTADG